MIPAAASQPTARLPTFSVVVPTFDRPAALARCLDALEELDYPRDRLEVVIVDDGSRAPAVVGARRVRVRVHRCARGGPARARNVGARIAAGEYVAFTDDDCRPAPGWLSGLAAALAAHPDGGAGGPVVNALAANPCAEASQLLVSFLYEYYNADPLHARFFATSNLAFRRDAFLRAGGFDTRYRLAAGEDRELCDRWTAANRPLVFAPGAVVHHAHDLSLASLWRQHFTYGRAAWGFREARAHRRAGPVQVEPLAFYQRLIAYPVQVHGAAGVPLSLLLLLAQVANAAGFVAESARVRGRRSRSPQPG